jgi:hypothetical protein
MTQVQSLSLANECVINKLDLLTNTTVVVKAAIMFVKEQKNSNNYNSRTN